MSTWYVIPSDNDLLHYGKMGMKWGVRNEVYKPSAGRRKRGYSSPSNSAYQSNKKKGTQSAIKKTGDTGRNNSGMNNFGNAVMYANGAAGEQLLTDFDKAFTEIMDSGEVNAENLALIQKIFKSVGKDVVYKWLTSFSDDGARMQQYGGTAKENGRKFNRALSQMKQILSKM